MFGKFCNAQALEISLSCRDRGMGTSPYTGHNEDREQVEEDDGW